MEKNVVKISIVGTNQQSLSDAKDRLIKRHLVAGMSYNECKTTYWNGGQIIECDTNIIRGITFYHKIPDIERALPDGVTIISACPSSYVNPKTERWLNESIT